MCVLFYDVVICMFGLLGTWVIVLTCTYEVFLVVYSKLTLLINVSPKHFTIILVTAPLLLLLVEKSMLLYYNSTPFLPSAMTIAFTKFLWSFYLGWEPRSQGQSQHYDTHWHGCDGIAVALASRALSRRGGRGAPTQLNKFDSKVFCLVSSYIYLAMRTIVLTQPLPCLYFLLLYLVLCCSVL